MKIGILDYGVGNLLSVQNMLNKIGVRSELVNSIDTDFDCTHLILPGVGHFEHCMAEFEKSGLRAPMESMIFEKKMPLLGICVGHQMLYEGSEEGNIEGLGYVPGKVIKFSFEAEQNLRIPHMNWSYVKIEKENPLYPDKITEFDRFYFVHSYHSQINQYSILTAEYGYGFCAAVQKENIFGVQFHPEKSHNFGMQLLKNFSIYHV